MTVQTEQSSSNIFSKIRSFVGEKLASFLTQPRADYRTFATLNETQLKRHLLPGDLILVEGNSRVSSAIKYLTQSTWSHVCVYIGEQEGLHPLIEADLVDGVITVPLDKYKDFNLRICRPVGLSEKDTQALFDFLIERLGHQYDTKNIFDLMRYLMPTPPVPQRFRRRLLEFGSGDPTKAICSTLVAQAFQSIRYPILPMSESELQNIDENTEQSFEYSAYQLSNNRLKARHYSHFTPRDFDLSPYFEVVKPSLKSGFSYKKIIWSK